MVSIPLSVSGLAKRLDLTFSFSIDELVSDWNCFENMSSLMSYSFLKTIEDCPPKALKPVYAILYDDKQKPVGLFIFQIKYFKAKESMRFDEEQDIFCKMHLRFRSIVANLVEFNTLVCGNLLLTGPYGLALSPEYVEHESILYQHVIEEIQGWLRASGYDTNVTLVKDFFSSQDTLKESTYHPFCIQPNMIMHFDQEWQSFDGYLNSLHSKYRIRAKRAKKAAATIVKSEMNLEQVKLLNNSIYQLYKQTAISAEFNLLDLHPDYFATLKQNMGDQVHFYAYTLNEKLVAFYTIIEDGEFNEAHFLGIQEDLNKSHQIYLNILFDLIKFSLDAGKSAIRFSRTATEIKSSVGAKPYEMTCYIKHRKVMNNTFVPYLLDFLNQKQNYVLRHPFKESVLEDTLSN